MRFGLINVIWEWRKIKCRSETKWKNCHAAQLTFVSKTSITLYRAMGPEHSHTRPNPGGICRRQAMQTQFPAKEGATVTAEMNHSISSILSSIISRPEKKIAKSSESWSAILSDCWYARVWFVSGCQRFVCSKKAVMAIFTCNVQTQDATTRGYNMLNFFERKMQHRIFMFRYIWNTTFWGGRRTKHNKDFSLIRSRISPGLQ